MFGKKKTAKKLDAAVLAINSMLAQIYKNKSTDEYKMKGDITKSPSYKQLEEMIADLKSLKGYSQNDADDMAKLFNTLHRPVFKTMVKEYIVDPNDKNTVFTSMFTIGYRLLVGELARIFAATEATPKGIVYKPNKMSRKDDASKLIKLFNDDLERKLNEFVQSMKKHPEDSPVNESYLMLLLDSLIQETVEPEEKESAENGAPGPVNEADEPVPGDDAPAAVEEGGQAEVSKVNLDDGTTDVLERIVNNGKAITLDEMYKRADEIHKSMKGAWKRNLESKIKPASVKESDEIEVGSGDSENDLDAQKEDNDPTNAGNTVTESAVYQEDGHMENIANWLDKKAKSADNYSKLLGVVVGSVALIGGLFSDAVGLLRGLNPISDINYMFMNSYDKKVSQLGNVAQMYEATKKAYEDYMKIPESQRQKKVESKYIKAMEKYNIQMNNLSAQIEHFNSRAKKESEEVVNNMEKKIPKNDVPKGNDSGNTSTSNNDDDDFQF